MTIISQDEYSIFAIVDGQVWKAICHAKFSDSRTPLFHRWHLRGHALEADYRGVRIQPMPFWVALESAHLMLN